MENIAVVYSPEDNNLSADNILNRFIPRGLKRLLMEKRPPVWKLLDLEDLRCKVLAIQFPSTKDRIRLISNASMVRMCKSIEASIRRFGTRGVVLDRNLNELAVIRDCFSSLNDIHLFTGRELFLACIGEVLAKISRLLKVNIGYLKIGIIADVFDTQVISVINKISREARFLNILSLDYNLIERTVDEIYNDTGLVIKLSRDTRKALTDCHIIINFSNNKEFISSSKLPDNSIIINSGVGIANKNLKGIVINGLSVCRSNNISNTDQWVNQLGFCEAVLSKTGSDKEGEVQNEYFLEDGMKGMRKLGYRISGFMGINGRIDMTEFDMIAKTFRFKETG